MPTAAEQQYLEELERQKQKTQQEIAKLEQESATKKPSAGNSLLIPAALGGGYLLTNGFSSMPSLSNAEMGLQSLGEALGFGAPTVAEGVAEGVPAAFEGVTGSFGAGAAGTYGQINQALSGNLIGPALGAYQGYKLIDRLSDESRRGSPLRSVGEGAAAGAAIGSYFGLPGAGIGAGVGALAGLAGKLSASGKSKNQMKRDQIRKHLQKQGALDENWNVTLPTGTFDYGKDGGAKLQNADGQGERKYSEIDWNNPLSNRAVGLANPLGYMLGGKDSKIALDMVGYNTNAITTGAKDEAEILGNARALYNKFGVSDRASFMSSLDKLKSDGAIDEEKYKAFAAEAPNLFPDQAPTSTGGSSGGNIELREEKKMDKKRLNAPINVPFSEQPRGGYSTGVNQYMNMLGRMSQVGGV